MGEALSKKPELPLRIIVDSAGVWWREFEDFRSLIPSTTPSKAYLPENQRTDVAVYALVRDLDEITSIVETDPAEEVAISSPPPQCKMEELSVGYEARWHSKHVRYNIAACADCRRERHQGLR